MSKVSYWIDAIEAPSRSLSMGPLRGLIISIPLSLVLWALILLPFWW
jgi:hypothetical protein